MPANNGDTVAMRTMFVLLLILGSTANSQAGDWPAGFVVHEGSQSPDGKFGILVPSLDSDNTDESNYLANLKVRKILGPIEGVNYTEHENHADLKTIWSSDSSVCLVDDEARFGFATLRVLTIRKDGKTFDQLDVGKVIQKSLDTITVRQTHDSDSGGEATPYYRIGGDHCIRFRVISTTNPKELEGVRTACALFQGTFDVTAAKWKVTDARSITPDDAAELYTAFSRNNDWDNTGYPDVKSEAADLDRVLNEVYRSDRLILPKAAFAKIKTDQIAWLKTCDTAPTPEAQNALTKARIEALKDVLW